jgi:nucleotide-binding universal stress UspA family protein
MADPGSGPAVLAYDGFEPAQDAVRFAARTLELPRAVAVTAWTGLTDLVLRPQLYSPGGPLAEARAEVDREEAKAGLELAEVGAALARESGFDEATAQALHRDSKPVWKVLLEGTRELDPAIVVAGARGRGGLKSSLLGSVSRSLAAHSPFPVLIARWDTNGAPPRGPVMICHDGSDSSRRATETAARLLPDGTEVTVAHVTYSWLAHSTIYLPIVHGEVQSMARELDERGLTAARERAEAGARLATEAGLTPVGTEARLTDATLARELVRIANDTDASLVVMGSHGMTGLVAALGSVSEGVLHRLHRPLLIVPEPDSER